MIGCVLVAAIGFLGLLLGATLRSIFGVSPLLALIAGVLGSVACTYGVWNLMRWWTPPFPVCRTGRCRAEADYRVLKASAAGLLVVCRCGGAYWRTRYADRSSFDGDELFVEVVGGRCLQPFERRTRFGRWRSATSLPAGLASLPSSLVLEAYRTPGASGTD